MKTSSEFLHVAAILSIVACGQAPSFVDSGRGALSSSEQGQPSSDDATVQTPEDTVNSTPSDNSDVVVVPGGGTPGNNGSTPSTPVFKNDPSNPESPTFVIPDIKPGEVDQVAACIRKWKKVPFTGTFTNVKRIKASVSVYGIGNAINDVAQTSEPALILVDAGVNVMGTPTYNMLNHNGYYCMKVNVNVKTDLKINLECDAKLADTSVQVNVNSQTNSGTSVIGVNVGSTVMVDKMTPSKQACAQ
ncbi:MAG: hypothetical protein NT027_15900 [Proteobacteria bacterium]|nr:hypothetical protein [Pseudomonadota bacterium]